MNRRAKTISTDHCSLNPRWARRNRLRCLILSKRWLSAAALALVSLASNAHAQTSTWTGAGTNTLWFNTANWNSVAAPNGATYDAVVGAPSPTVLNGNVLLNSLTVQADGVLQVQNSRSISFGGTEANPLTNLGSIAVGTAASIQVFGNVNNAGSISLTHAVNTSPSDLRVMLPGATFSGGGTITLAGGSARITAGIANAGPVTILDQTIQGRGQIGTNNLEFVVEGGGLIDANASGGLLTLDTSAAGMVNRGVLRASNGGTLTISDSSITNDVSALAGRIEALAGSAVVLSNNTAITGGELTGDGAFNALNTTLTAIANSGTIAVGSANTARISGTINNSGDINLTHAVNTGAASLSVLAGGATLDGGGTVTIAGSGNSGLITGIAGETLTIADQTIQGQGQLGVNSIGLTLESNALVDANTSGTTMILDSGAPGVTNQGTLQASNGGKLLITDSAVANQGGVIQALSGSTIGLGNGASIVGGELAGDGTIAVETSATATLRDLTQNSNLAIGNSATARIGGSIQNVGNINITNGVNSGAASLSVLAGGATLDGGGAVAIGGTGNSGLITGVAGETLTIANQTIQGRGQVGNNSIGLILESNALLDANLSGTSMVLNSGTPGVMNSGVIRASGGGKLTVLDSSITNTGGSIQSLAGSTVELGNNSSITGGVLSGAGNFQVLQNQSTSLSDLTHTGSMNVNIGSQVRLSGAINNTGVITMDHPVNTGLPTLLVESTGATLSGGGTIQMFGSGGAARIRGGTGGALTIANQTIEGAGNVGTDNLELTNGPSGNIHANVAGSTMTLDPLGHATWTNHGTLSASGGGTLSFVGSTLVNEGLLYSASGGVVRADELAFGVTLHNLDTIDVGAGGSVEWHTIVNEGLIQGNGSITATSFINDGLISPGTSPGNLIINTASAVLQDNSSLLFEIEGNQIGEFDTLDFFFSNPGGSVQLGGALLVDLNGYTPDATDSFAVLSSNSSFFNSIAGGFNNVSATGELWTVGNEGFFNVDRIGDSIVLNGYVSVVPEPTAFVTLLVGLVGCATVRRRKR